MASPQLSHSYLRGRRHNRSGAGDGGVYLHGRRGDGGGGSCSVGGSSGSGRRDHSPDRWDHDHWEVGRP